LHPGRCRETLLHVAGRGPGTAGWDPEGRVAPREVQELGRDLGGSPGVRRLPIIMEGPCSAPCGAGSRARLRAPTGRTSRFAKDATSPVLLQRKTVGSPILVSEVKNLDDDIGG
jgi:hypothetical protein